VSHAQLLPQRGDFEVVPTGGAGGKLIRLGQILNGSGFTDYEHARIYVGGGKCVEAEPGGASYCNFDPNDGGLWSTGLLNLSPNDRSVIAGSADHYAHLGVGYSAADYFALAARRLQLGLLVPGLRTYVQSSGHMICSQLVDRCYKDAHIELFDDKRWDGYVTPGDLAELIIKLKSRQAAQV
jgi:hypothetical protein